MCLRVPADRDVVELRRRKTGIPKAPRRGGRRKPGDMLHAVEALFLGRADEFTVDDQGRSCVAVVGVQAKDGDHRQNVAETAGCQARDYSLRVGLVSPIRTLR